MPRRIQIQNFEKETHVDPPKTDPPMADLRAPEKESSNPTGIHDCPKKRIIVACDGTWMDSDGVEQTPSNITRIVRAVSQSIYLLISSNMHRFPQ